MLKRLTILLLTMSLIVLGFSGLSAADMEKEHPTDKPLKIPADMGYRPYHYYNEQHEPEGYTIDLVREIARRLGRPGVKVIDVNWSGIFAGLFSKKYEMVIGGVNITHGRADKLDFTEPIMTQFQGFAVRCEDKEDVNSVEDLKGLKMGSNSGSAQDKWATENKNKYGFKLSRFDKIADAVMALQTRKIDVVIADKPTTVAFTEDRPNLCVTPINLAPATDWGVTNLIGTGAAFRQGDPFRDKVEKVLEGMKLDGTLQEIMEPYFGKPSSSDYANIVYPGYGTPGIKAYEPESYHKPIFDVEEGSPE